MVFFFVLIFIFTFSNYFFEHEAKLRSSRLLRKSHLFASACHFWQFNAFAYNLSFFFLVCFVVVFVVSFVQRMKEWMNERTNEPRATICPVKCSTSPSQVGKLHRCLVKPDTLDLTEQCKEETALSVEDLAKAEPLDKVLQQVSPRGHSSTRPGPCSRCHVAPPWLR